MLILIKVPELSVSLCDKTFLPPHPPHCQGSAKEQCRWGNPNMPLFSWGFTGATTLSKPHPHSPKGRMAEGTPVSQWETRDPTPASACACSTWSVSLPVGPAGIVLLQQPCPYGLPDSVTPNNFCFCQPTLHQWVLRSQACWLFLGTKICTFPTFQANKTLCSNEYLDPKAQTFTT